MRPELLYNEQFRVLVQSMAATLWNNLLNGTIAIGVRDVLTIITSNTSPYLCCYHYNSAYRLNQPWGSRSTGSFLLTSKQYPSR